MKSENYIDTCGFIMPNCFIFLVRKLCESLFLPKYSFKTKGCVKLVKSQNPGANPISHKVF